MPKTDFKVYGIRWMMLIVYMFMVAVNQLLWITFAPITGDATKYYGVSDLRIGILSMCFMIVYIVVSIPASWIIDKFGITIGVGIGAVFTGVFGLVRGFAGPDYNLLAHGTNWHCNWSAIYSECNNKTGCTMVSDGRTGYSSRSWYPGNVYWNLAGNDPYTLSYNWIRNRRNALYLWNYFNSDNSYLSCILIKEGPPTAPCRPDQEERSLVFDGFKQTLRTKDFILLMVIFFIGLGVFNAVTTWIEDILRPRGFSATQAGITGGSNDCRRNYRSTLYSDPF